MKTRSEQIYREARNAFARANTDATKVFDEACVSAFLGSFAVKPISEALRQKYVREAEATYGVTWGDFRCGPVAAEIERSSRDHDIVKTWIKARDSDSVRKLVAAQSETQPQFD